MHEEGYNDLMEEDGIYGVSGVLIDGGKWYLQCVGCDVGSFVEYRSRDTGKMDGLCVFVKM